MSYLPLSPENVVLSRDAQVKQSHAIDAVILDWDRTITKSAKIYGIFSKRAANTLKAEGYHEEKTKAETARGLTNEEHFEQRFSQGSNQSGVSPGVRGAQIIDEMIADERIMQEVIDGVELRDGAIETIQYLQSHYIPIAVVSNSPDARVKKMVEAVFQEHGVEGVPAFGVKEGVQGKPHPDLVDAALKELKVEPGSSVFFVGDDAQADMRAALNAKVVPILIDASQATESPCKQARLLQGGSQPNADVQVIENVSNWMALKKLFATVIEREWRATQER